MLSLMNSLMCQGIHTMLLILCQHGNQAKNEYGNMANANCNFTEKRLLPTIDHFQILSISIL